MFTYGKSRTEEQLLMSQKRAERARTERDEAEQEKAAQKARLRALRLANENADKEDNG